MSESRADAVDASGRKCSFCKKSEAEVGYLVEGPKSDGESSAFICALCLELCSSILEQQKHEGELEGAENGAALRQMVDEVVNNLSDQEFRVIELRYGLATGYSLSLEEVGRDLDITPERVAEIESGAVAKLKADRE
jgi:RNA polymerase primary sigma factor